MKIYDYAKVEHYIEKYISDIDTASLGMHEDWFWTAQTIFEGGKYLITIPHGIDLQVAREEYNTKHTELFRKFMDTEDEVEKSIIGKQLDELRNEYDYIIGGMIGSKWATPTLQLVFKNGEDVMIPCYVGESSGDNYYGVILGVLSGPVQDNITPLTDLD